MRDAAEFWEELLAHIESRRVIPVVGPELLTVETTDGIRSLYAVLAERLLAKYGVAFRAAAAGDDATDRNQSNVVTLRPSHELNDAVCALTQAGRRVQDLYRPINDLLKELLRAPSEDALQPLKDLAGIDDFRLFITTTPDDLLFRAIDATRHEGTTKTEQLIFAPKRASGTSRDLPEVLDLTYSAVCYLFGKASVIPFVYAIHDEDTLEFVHTLQINGGEGIKRLFSELRKQNLLLIGCDMADWLSRFFIRLSNTQRLADNRTKHEFLIERATEDGGSLTLFLERFSPDTWVFRDGARQFVAELARRWHERNPNPRPILSAPKPTPPEPQRRVEDLIFVSYAHEDIAAARQLHAGLQEIGANVSWFDKSDLRSGDDWMHEIREAIRGCHLFLPLISETTEGRDEGFFREEWTLASERRRRIQGRKFVVPIVIDKDYNGCADDYRLVPDAFPAAQFGHAPGGELSLELKAELTRLIRERRLQKAT